jgi:hypothetical protein
MFSGNDRVFLGGDRQRKCLSSDRQNNVSCLQDYQVLYLHDGRTKCVLTVVFRRPDKLSILRVIYLQMSTSKMYVKDPVRGVLTKQYDEVLISQVHQSQLFSVLRCSRFGIRKLGILVVKDKLTKN